MLFIPLATPSVLQADLLDGYTMQSYNSVIPDGQFTANNGQIHYWSNSYNTPSGKNGYNIYNVATGSTTKIGLPPNGTNSNGYGDAFGVFDSTNNAFYAATYSDNGSYVYKYDGGTGKWNTTTSAGVYMPNAYGGQVHNSQLYVAGLATPWNGSTGQNNYIFAFDHAAMPDGAAPRHDTLIQTTGNSGNVAIASNGDVYYGTYNTDTLYRWTASQVAGVTDDLYATGAVDSYLTLTNAEQSWSLPGGSNGVAVDNGGHVFFTANDSSTGNGYLGMLDSSASSGYREIYTCDGYAWPGAISVDGNFLNGGTLYFSPAYGGGLAGIQAVPEPGAFTLLGTAGLIGLIGFTRRRKACLISTVSLLAMAAIATITVSGQSVSAGIYSTAKANETTDAPDAGIAGFVGDAGEGVTATTSNGNYVNPVFKGWATEVTDYSPAPGVASNWKTTTNALGAVTGNNMGIVTLGDLYSTSKLTTVDPTITTDNYGFIGYDSPGSITLKFAHSITNGSGADFAVFENAFISNSSGLDFAELGYVDVSTDGVNFARFASVSLTSGTVGGYGCVDPTDVYNLAGKHVNAYGDSWGTPFDLGTLASDASVASGLVDLSQINYVRIVDIPGSGDYLDSLGNPIYDAWVTYGSGGLDLEAVGVINQVPEPGTLVGTLAAFGTIGLWQSFRRHRCKQA
jgi:hypothetical protein